MYKAHQDAALMALPTAAATTSVLSPIEHSLLHPFSTKAPTSARVMRPRHARQALVRPSRCSCTDMLSQAGSCDRIAERRSGESLNMHTACMQSYGWGQRSHGTLCLHWALSGQPPAAQGAQGAAEAKAADAPCWQEAFEQDAVQVWNDLLDATQRLTADMAL